MIKNFLEIKKQPIVSHEGIGKVDLYEVWNSPDFINKVDFFDRVVMPPKTSMGYHKHGNDEELYIILEGQGTMTIEEKETVVKKGDMIKNPPFGSHGLVNDSDTELDLLILQLKIDE
jgi:mannose-6-phosphate isomerase-like protein (cupin superfamily)